jgi:hypothetical protein
MSMTETEASPEFITMASGGVPAAAVAGKKASGRVNATRLDIMPPV